MKHCSVFFALTCSLFLAVKGQIVPLVCPIFGNLAALTGYTLSSNPDDIHFWFYPANGDPRKEIIYNNAASLLSSGFNKDAVIKTVILIHGFIDNSTIHLPGVVLPAYLSTNLNYGYIVPDWSLLSGNNPPIPNTLEMAVVYAQVVCQNIDIVVHRTTQFINWLALDPSKVHIIGHSLGAHISGNVGGRIQQTNNGGKSIARITGLDPAGPLFFIPLPFPKINRTNAQFVDIIHTDMGVLGDASVDGHADFFPNGGVNQPGCILVTDLNPASSCSHQYAPILYAASITCPNFPAYPCLTLSTNMLTGLITTCTPFIGAKLALCKSTNQPVYMGENCLPTTRGLFYLTTTNPPCAPTPTPTPTTTPMPTPTTTPATTTGGFD